MISKDPSIRLCEPRDWPVVVAIYNQAIADGGSTADTEPFTVDQRRDWFAQHDGREYPLFVAEAGGSAIGWCSLSAHRPGRKALRKVAEISYFVDRAHRRRGIARALVEHALQRAPDYGFRNLFALLLDINQPSIQLLESTGFARWGHLPGVADFDGVVCGQLIYGRATAQ